MKVYVAGQLAELEAVRAVQQQVVSAGHELTHDWTRDLSLTQGYADCPERSAAIAGADLDGVMTADAVVVVASSAVPGRGLFVELGAALARAELGQLDHVVVVGEIVHESVFYLHPRVCRVAHVGEWLTGITQLTGRPDGSGGTVPAGA
jgi:hypothetical protein